MEKNIKHYHLRRESDPGEIRYLLEQEGESLIWVKWDKLHDGNYYFRGHTVIKKDILILLKPLHGILEPRKFADIQNYIADLPRWNETKLYMDMGVETGYCIVNSDTGKGIPRDEQQRIVNNNQWNYYASGSDIGPTAGLSGSCVAWTVE